MAYRIFAGAVVTFWGVMMFFLVRSERESGHVPAWMQVPPQHVIELVFRQQEDSELSILQGGRKQGSLLVMPRRGGTEGRRLVSNGEMYLKLPGATKTQRVLFDGWFDLDAGNNVRRFTGRVVLREPAVTFQAEIDPAAGSFTYSSTEEGRPTESTSGTFADLLRDPRFAFLGLDPNRFNGIAHEASKQAAEVEAHPSFLKTKGERISTYRLVIHGGMETVVHVTQTGRILRIDTPFGITLAAEGLEP